MTNSMKCIRCEQVSVMVGPSGVCRFCTDAEAVPSPSVTHAAALDQFRRALDVPPMSPSDPVNHPAHYRTAAGIESIDVIEAFGLGFRAGNAVKYILRAGKKDPKKHIEDLEKAAWYVAREIAALKRGGA